MSAVAYLKRMLFPPQPSLVRILRGPFRGAIIRAELRHSLRKMFGLYERELNAWIEAVLPHVNTVLDVGANDGYFTFGCAAAFRRLGKSAEIVSFEPQCEQAKQLQVALREQPRGNIRITVVEKSIGAEPNVGVITLNDAKRFLDSAHGRTAPDASLIKIDVEGAEMEVIAGAFDWLKPSNYFMIEVHDPGFVDQLQQCFSGYGLELLRFEEKPLPFIGREHRSSLGQWLVSKL